MSRQIRFTPRQRQIYDFIRRYTAENGFPPTLEEIAGHLGLSAPSTVHEHLEQMQRKGILKRVPHKRRSTEAAVAPVAPAVELPLLGSVVAGPPTESFLVPETIAVPAHMVGRGKHFALRVMGESMQDEDIAEGDVLVVRQSPRAAAGDLVIALVEGQETTVKRFFPEKRNVRLQPSNRQMRPIRVRKDAVEIQGIVVGLLRTYS
jgi:repressor LexA